MSATIWSWLLALVLAALFFFLGFWAKIFAAEFMGDPTSPDLFSKINFVANYYIGDFAMDVMEPYGRWVIGVLEMITAILIIIPATRMAGAFLGFVITAGAIGSHIAGEFVPESEFGLAVITNGQADYALFGTAVVMFILSIALLVVGGRD